MEHARRHKFFWQLLHLLAAPFFRWRFRYSCEKVPASDTPALILSNHTTDFDPIFVGMSFRQHMYYVASEHTFRFGFASRLIRFVFAPIPRVKGKTDARTGLDVIRRMRKGHNVCIFAEGNRTFNGQTGPILPSTGKLAQASGGDLVTYRLEGGYFTTPRWGKGIRRGRMRGHVVHRYTKEQLRAMSSEEVNDIIKRDLFEDAYARQQQAPVAYKGKRPAEFLQTALYLCPACGALATLSTHGDAFHCPCGLQGRYDEYGALHGSGFSFKTVTEWDAWQTDAFTRLLQTDDAPLPLRDEAQQLYRVTPCIGSELLAEGTLTMDRDALCCAQHAFPLAAISDIAITGRTTLTFATTGGEQYEIKSQTPRSALKYWQAFQVFRA